MFQEPPTFHQQVEPLLQHHCQACHHAGGMAPFALVEYAEVVGWAPQIDEVVAAGRMPPWHADPAVGKWKNDRSLPADDRAALLRWIEAGTPRGDPAKAPPRRVFSSGWGLGEPDLVLTTPPRQVPAEGTLPYDYIQVPTSLTADRWIRAFEVQSTAPDVIHHVLVFLTETDASRERTKELLPSRPWRPVFDPTELLQGARPQDRGKWTARFRDLIRNDLRHGDAGGLNGYFASGLAGGGPLVLAPGQAKLLPAGASVTFQIHTTPSGQAKESRTSLGLYFSSEPPERVLEMRGVSTVVFEIPPGAPSHEVRARYVLPRAALLTALQPHMHLRGSSFRFEAETPDGRRETLLIVPRYDFDWQYPYLLAEPRWLAEGTILHAIATYDNGPGNPCNPDPSQPVFFGLQTRDEMMIGYFEVAWAQTEEESRVRSQPPSPPRQDVAAALTDPAAAPPAPRRSGTCGPACRDCDR